MGYLGRGIITIVAILCTIIFLTVDDDIVHIVLLISSMVIAWIMGFYYDRVKYISEIDTLTGVRNRRNANKVFTRLRRQASRKSLLLVVFVVDVNNFKSINDNFDHHAGDSVLRLISELLVDVFRIRNHVIRWGGDEFIVIHTFQNDEKLQEACNLLHEQTDSLSQQLTFDISLSVGFSMFSKDGDNLEDLMGKADKEMYANKVAQKRIEKISNLKPPYYCSGADAEWKSMLQGNPYSTEI